MSSCTRHYTVVRNGKLTKHISKIIDHYRQLGVNVELVLEDELNRLKGSLLVSQIFETEQTQHQNNIAKIKALTEILCVLNS